MTLGEIDRFECPGRFLYPDFGQVQKVVDVLFKFPKVLVGYLQKMSLLFGQRANLLLENQSEVAHDRYHGGF